MKKKQFGILCHVTSLKSGYGIGDFGKSSIDFIDFLSENSIDIWQILPLSETNEYNCPYGSCCSFAFDSRFVDLDDLFCQKLITKEDLTSLKENSGGEKVNYAFVVKEKKRLIGLAYSRLKETDKLLLMNWAQDNKDFYDYAYFKTLLEVFGVFDWKKLPKEYICCQNSIKENFVAKNQDKFLKYIFVQKLLLEQWKRVKEYANKKGIRIIGDLPIYCEPFSFDVFAAPEYYILDKNYYPAVFGGVPGDDFNYNGQIWGTCVYNWRKIEKENFKFFVDKIARIISLYDIVRLDHYNGYCDHFEVDTTVKEKVTGKWVKAGGQKLFDVLEQNFGLDKFIVEDLGEDRPESVRVKKLFNLVGMCVLQFANDRNSAYLPQNVEKNSVYYLGTHDNNTFVGFLDTLDKDRKQNFCNLVGVDFADNKTVAIECMKKVLSSKTKFKIFAIQDLLLQDENFRMNIPGQSDNCWAYKLPNNYKARVAKTIENIVQHN